MFPFQPFRKTALLKARILTEEDYKKRDGVVKTLEGVVAFVPGDYLLQGVENEEWVVIHHHFQVTYERISDPDKEGFALYYTNEIRLAFQVSEAFFVKIMNGDILNGKRGDYLVKSGENIWITDRAIFERTYEAVSC
jgi:PGDYG protein